MHRSRKKKPTPIPEEIREALIDRVEAAVLSGSLAVTSDQWGALLHALFPEDFRAPPLSDSKATSPPASAARVAEYAARQAAGESVFNSADAKGDSGRGMETVWSRTKGPRVVGWAGSGNGPEDRDGEE